jgi:heme-degrading monooxygenase HmoA
MKKLDDAKWVVLFVSKKRENISGYDKTLERMLDKVKTLPGFIHLETFTNDFGMGVAISYWKNKESINEWGSDFEHIKAQKRGIVDWYSQYQIVVGTIDDYYDFNMD